MVSLKKDPSKRTSAILRPIAVLAAVVWTALIFASLVYHYIDSSKHIVGLAHEAALGSIQKDLLYRFWAAGHGGVYVPVSPTAQPKSLPFPCKKA